MTDGISEAPRGNGEYIRDQRLVLDTLQRHEAKLDRISREINELRGDITILKVKAGLWGALAGAVPGSIAILMILLKQSE